MYYDSEKSFTIKLYSIKFIEYIILHKTPEIYDKLCQKNLFL